MFCSFFSVSRATATKRQLPAQQAVETRSDTAGNRRKRLRTVAGDRDGFHRRAVRGCAVLHHIVVAVAAMGQAPAGERERGVRGPHPQASALPVVAATSSSTLYSNCTGTRNINLGGAGTRFPGGHARGLPSAPSPPHRSYYEFCIPACLPRPVPAGHFGQRMIGGQLHTNQCHKGCRNAPLHPPLPQPPRRHQTLALPFSVHSIQTQGRKGLEDCNDCARTANSSFAASSTSSPHFCNVAARTAFGIFGKKLPSCSSLMFTSPSTFFFSC